MKKTIISLNELRHGIVLPAAIYDANNSQLLLLNCGITLTQDKIEGLRKRGVSQIAIDSKFGSDIRTGLGSQQKGLSRKSQVLNELRTRETDSSRSLSNALKKPTTPQYDTQLEKSFVSANQKHSEHLENFFADLHSDSTACVRCEPLSIIADESIDLLLGDIDLFVKLAIESSQTPAANEHCLKVSKLAMSIATILEFNKEDVCHLGMGCLMSRIGIGEDIQKLINLPREFTPLETLEMKKHASRKLRLLEQIPGLPIGVKQVAWQIHERWNGSGYPRGRSAQQIPPLVRIASVADVYVAMTSERPHRKAMAPYTAIETILDDTRQGLFEPNAVRGLLQTISLFPLGSHVELSNKMYAVTIRNHSQFYDRPIVKVICDSFGLPVQQDIIVLSEQLELQIVRTLNPRDIEKLLEKRKQQDEVLDIAMDWSEEISVT